MKLKGDIVIADPMYIFEAIDSMMRAKVSPAVFKKRVAAQRAAIKEKTKDHTDFTSIGFTKYLIADVSYGGSWFSTIHNGNNRIGSLTTDTKKLGVFLLDEVIAYNDEFNPYGINMFAVSVIENFDGDISLKSNKSTGVAIKSKGSHNLSIELDYEMMYAPRMF